MNETTALISEYCADQTEMHPVVVGNLISSLLKDCWLDSRTENNFNDHQLATIFSYVHKSDFCGLIWRKVKNDSSIKTKFDYRLKQAFRYYSIHAALNDRNLARLSNALQANSYNFILGKGWAIARFYPEPWLRPYSDFDIYLQPGIIQGAKELLAGVQDLACNIDFHAGLFELNDRSFDEVLARTLLVPVGDTQVRVFGHEDHLRLISLHMLRHGAWRPLWLCDVAVAFESRPDDFDWDYFLGGDRRRTEWVIASIGLAHRLLGARIEGTPIEKQALDLPRWLVDTVLTQWGKEPNPHGARLPMRNYLKHPAGIVEAMLIRWPNAIEATVGLHGPFNDLPRLPFQIGECIRRVCLFIPRIPALLRNQ